MLKKEFLNQFTKDELVSAILGTQTLSSEYVILEERLKRVQMKKKSETHDRLYKETVKADEDWSKAFTRFSNYQKEMLDRYGVKVENGSFNYGDLFRLVPVEVQKEYLKEIDLYNEAVKRKNKAEKKFIDYEF